MPENLTFQVVNVDEREDQTSIDLEGTASSIMPDFVVTTRARLKAIRVVGGEHVVRGAVNEITMGNLSRVTEILVFETDDDPPDMRGIREVFVTVIVKTGD